jgi:hypothetical protein
MQIDYVIFKIHIMLQNINQFLKILNYDVNEHLNIINGLILFFYFKHYFLVYHVLYGNHLMIKLVYQFTILSMHRIDANHLIKMEIEKKVCIKLHSH